MSDDENEKIKESAFKAGYEKGFKDGLNHILSYYSIKFQEDLDKNEKIKESAFNAAFNAAFNE